MTMLTVEQPSRQALQHDTKPASIPPRTKQALRLMIEEGLTYQLAAERVGMHVRHMRKAIEKQHVLNYLRAQRQVFRAAISAPNDLRLAQVRDNSKNAMAIVAAVKALERIDDERQSASTRMQSPGFVIVVQAQPAAFPQPSQSHNTKTIEHDNASNNNDM